MNQFGKNILIWMFIFIGAMGLFGLMESAPKPGTDVSYSEFWNMVNSGQLTEVTIQGQTLIGDSGNGQKLSAVAPYDPDLIKTMRDSGVDIKVMPSEEGNSFLVSLFLQLLPVLLIVAVWIFVMRQMQGGGKGGAMTFGKSRAVMMTENQVKVTFDDVAGVAEAKQDLEEIVEFLADPGKFQRLGGKIPKGALLMGPPGTGKTLLARSVAGEAGVPFFSISGSDFVEMFVGVGASRVRDLFEQGKKNAPCIIFIDEIDAVGRHRGAGLGGGNDEREQTLNQLLVEMDGFESNEGVILIAATNRPDVLDPALMRPGRFDRQIVVPLPDISGREQILNVHMKKVPMAGDVDSSVIARGTPGFSGADLANLVNESALMAARRNKRLIDMDDFESAKDKVMMGAERKSTAMTEEQKRTTAVHEAGHAIVTHFLQGPVDPLHKVTIIPRGRALGVTMSLPEEDKFTHDKKYLENQIAILMGGRIAEELVLDQKTTGASNDIERATDLARKMVTAWGMSEKMGPLSYSKGEGSVFLGRELATSHEHISDATALEVDGEIRKFVDENYVRAKTCIEKHRKELDQLTDALLEYETLDISQIKDLFAGKDIVVKKESRYAKLKAAVKQEKKVEKTGKAKVSEKTKKNPKKPAKTTVEAEKKDDK